MLIDSTLTRRTAARSSSRRNVLSRRVVCNRRHDGSSGRHREVSDGSSFTFSIPTSSCLQLYFHKLLGSIYSARKRFFSVFVAIWCEHHNGFPKSPFTPNVSVNAAMTLAIQLSLKTIESSQNGLQIDSGATLFVFIVFNESSVASVIAALTLCWY